MGQVVISPNLKRTKKWIDANGNEIDPKNKQLIKSKEVEYVPTPEEVAGQAKLPVEPVKIPNEAKGKGNPLAEAIRKQVQEQVKKTLAEIDIGKMVKDAIEEAFK